jgi:ribosomal-protein-alanine N-acetyltransferase
MKPILETPRLILRQMSLADLDFMATMLVDPEVMRFYPKCYSRDEAAAWIRRQEDRYAKHGHGGWLVLNKKSGQPIGQVGLLQQTVEGVEMKEVGYLIHRPFWRQGFASEAAMATRDYAFHKLGQPRVISLIRPENVPSQGVARKMGMHPEDRHTHIFGYEHLIFAVSRDEIAGALDGARPDSALS